ncbi:electron transport complex subunit RsxC [bacterium]
MKTFTGGVHPKEYKELTQDLPIQKFPLADTVYIASSQHLGKPAKFIVKPGDIIEEGNLIGEADGFISAPIHSPITGKVKKITKHPHISGLNDDMVIIERDQEAQPKEWPDQDVKISDISKDDFVKIIKDKGIVGLGGAGFPTYVKFMTKENQKIEKLLINACECEPYVNCDNRAMLEYVEEFIEGLILIKNIYDIKEIIIGVESNKSKAVQKLRENLIGIPDIIIKVLKTKYPQGAEKMLIKALTNREVPRGGLPLDVGAIVLNVNTVIAIRNAVYCGKPILEKIVTVSGYGINNPKNILVKIGAPISEIIEFCGGTNDNFEKLIIGGPMMGIALSNREVPVIKTTTGLLALTKEEIGNTQIEPCLRCGSCVSLCPMGLAPSEIAKYVEYGRYDLAEKIGLKDCMECGTCVFTCPSNRPIVQLVKVGKMKVMK